MRTIKFLIFPLLGLLAAGCAQPPEATRPPTKAQKRLIELCRDEYNLDIITKAYDHTLWVYLPVDRSFLSITASEKGPIKSSTPEEKFVIHFLDGQFADHDVQISYDIGIKKNYTDHKGIDTKFSEEYQQKQQFLFSAMVRAYSDIEKDPDSDRYVENIAGDRDVVDEGRNTARARFPQPHVKTSPVPDFFIVIIADIEKGIEMRMYVALEDLRRAAQDQGFGEEYARRVIAEQPIGHKIIIGDKAGSHLETYDLSWGEFLTKQIVYRINFKYAQSAFPPDPDTVKQLTEIAAEAVQGYDFNDFNALQLRDLNTGTLNTIRRETLKTFEITPPRLPGKLHHLKFEINPPEEQQENAESISRIP